MASSLYPINPRSEAATHFGAESYEHFGFEPAQSIADLASGSLLEKLIRRGPDERRMWKTVWDGMRQRPESEPMVMQALYRYAQVCCLCETGLIWEPHLAAGGRALGPAQSGGGN